VKFGTSPRWHRARRGRLQRAEPDLLTAVVTALAAPDVSSTLSLKRGADGLRSRRYLLRTEHHPCGCYRSEKRLAPAVPGEQLEAPARSYSSSCVSTYEGSRFSAPGSLWLRLQ
jgi:hypothetical protein